MIVFNAADPMTMSKQNADRLQFFDFSSIPKFDSTVHASSNQGMKFVWIVVKVTDSASFVPALELVERLFVRTVQIVAGKNSFVV